jgi:hypothetical protein
MFGRFPGEEQGEAVKGVLRTNNPSKRMADPLEIAKLAVYLASDDSAYVVGADSAIPQSSPKQARMCLITCNLGVSAIPKRFGWPFF